ncbi:MAG: PTS sugar transporter subunit IIC [Candidatus Krumholzibacteria bacterium]|nr:PTS sugar transporter subunit IIC [Candidatus Krumholzibacteria bacterium]
MNAPVGGGGLESVLWWAGLALLGALVALDEHSLVQSWFSQPLPAAVLAGAMAGQPQAGLATGLLLQLAVIGNLPVGASYRLDTGSAAVGMTAGAVLAGWSAPAALLARSTWTAPASWQLGWLLVCMAVASLLGGVLVQGEQRAHLRWMLSGYRSVRDGDLRRLEQLHGRCLWLTGLRGAVLTLVWTLVSLWLWPVAAAGLPESARAGLAWLPLLVPALAAGTLLERFGYRPGWPLVAASAVTGFVVVRFLV